MSKEKGSFPVALRTGIFLDVTGPIGSVKTEWAASEYTRKLPGGFIYLTNIYT